jgi:hypothetical protein
VAVIRVMLLARTLRRNGSSVNNAVTASPDIYVFFISERMVVSMIGFAAFLATMPMCGLG